MDLIYTNSSRADVGVLLDYELDLAFGADENNFECTIQASSHCCEAGSLLYFEGTEYGGVIDSIKSNGSTKEVVYSGRTWHGVMNSKVLAPDSGEDYLIVSGEANALIGTLLTRMGLSDLFEASSENSGLTISSYKMNRYIKGYDGITKMLGSVGARIHLVFRDGKVIVSAIKKRDFSENEEFDSDQVGFTAKKNFRAVNHLICLGAGNLSERLVVHLYADTKGNISRTQTQFGFDEVIDTYERSDLATEDELFAEGKAQLKSLYDSDEVSIDFDADSDAYEVGDVIGAYDNITGLWITTTIAKKIVTIKNGKITVSLTPDTAKSSSAPSIGGGGGVPGANGEDGGFFVPDIDMYGEDTMIVSYTGSKDGMGVHQFRVQLPKADTLEVFKAVYPVGSCYVTSENTNPNDILGFGDWEIVDRSFTPQSVALDSLVTLNTTNCSEISVTAYLNGHNIYLIGSITTAVAITDSTLNMFTIKPSSVGLTSFHKETRHVTLTDGGNAMIYYYIGDDGVVSTRDTIVRGSETASLAKGSRHFVASVDVPYSVMLDSFCDKFCWKRTA